MSDESEKRLKEIEERLPKGYLIADRERALIEVGRSDGVIELRRACFYETGMV